MVNLPQPLAVERESRAARAINPSPMTENDSMLYSPMPLRNYNSNRHIKIEEAEGILRSEGLRPDKLRETLNSGHMRLYEFDGNKYVDRLDLGRLYHKKPKKVSGLTIERYFTNEGEQPLLNVPVRHTDLRIADTKGKVIFEMKDAELPQGWDEGDLVIVAQKYFYKPNKPEWRQKLKDKVGREYEFSPRHLIGRVTNFVTDMGAQLGYFASDKDRENFRAELAKIQLERKFAFNSPVQFNAGLFTEYGIEGSTAINYVKDPKTGKAVRIDEGCYVRPQSHACFIKGPEDSLESILDQVSVEGAIFSSGSGIGQNMSNLREQGAPLSSGGKSSGPMSFYMIWDRGAGAIQSGGKTRRAARMEILDVEHPDTPYFIADKVDADHKAFHLMQKGWSAGMDGEAVRTVPYQNTNQSLRVPGSFFEKVKNGGKVALVSVKTGDIVKEVEASDLLKRVAFGSWRIGDPAIQYRDAIDRMHTAPNSGRQRGSNPCSEYLFNDDTSCDLGSTSLVNFSDQKGKFDAKSFSHANRIATIGLDILNKASSYPVQSIAQISPEFSTIGVGYAGLGNLLMRMGHAYNSDEGRAVAGAITALMTGTAYKTSAELAAKMGTFTHFDINKKPMLNVIRTHRASLDSIAWDKVKNPELKSAAYEAWNEAESKGQKHGFRNAQATVLAPTGTISYLLGCGDSTGVEPSVSLMIWKNLAGGGGIVVKNREITNALVNLGYTPSQIQDIENYVAGEFQTGIKRNTVVGAPHIRPEHIGIFDTAMGNSKGQGSIEFGGHVRMLAAAQPFISGAISKTCNVPESTSVKQMYDNYVLGHDLGLKALAMFRTNSKPTSAVTHGERGFVELRRGEKEELPMQRKAYEFESKIRTHEGIEVPFHILVSEYADGRPGQIAFLSYKSGSTLGALLNTAGIQASKSLKRGVELEDVVSGWLGHEFQPNGFITGHEYIKTARSPLDFAAKVLLLEYMGQTEQANDPEAVKVEKLRGAVNGAIQTYMRRQIDDWDFNQVIANPELGGFVERAPEDKLRIIKEKAKSGNGNGTSGNSRGVICKACGNIMEQTAPGCFHCRVCGDKVGGCGI